MKSHVFRSYDIRGVVGVDFTAEQMYWLVRAFAAYVHEKNHHARSVLVGRDGRLSSPALHEQVVRALLDSGFEIFDTGICPSPVVYFGLYTGGYDAGIMITASHNTAEYNGLKLCLGVESVWGEEIMHLKALYEQKAMVHIGQSSCRHVAIQEAYVAYIVEQFNDLIGCPLSLVLDTGNGAAGPLLRACVKALKLPLVQILCEEVDGTYPNHQANPVELENMLHAREVLRASGADLACGFDGDGDRMAALTADGRLIAGDHLVALFAQDILKKFPGARIVYDGKCSMLVRETIVAHNGSPVMSPSGHSIIKSRMRVSGALFGGELSCHFFFKDCYFGFDDALYAFLRLVRLIYFGKKSFAALVDQFPAWYTSPELRIACADEIKQSVIERIGAFLKSQAVSVVVFDGIRIETSDGWGLVRASGTQPALCLRCESRTQDGLEALQKILYTALLQELPLIDIKEGQSSLMEQKER